MWRWHRVRHTAAWEPTRCQPEATRPTAARSVAAVEERPRGHVCLLLRRVVGLPRHGGGGRSVLAEQSRGQNEVPAEPGYTFGTSWSFVPTLRPRPLRDIAGGPPRWGRDCRPGGRRVQTGWPLRLHQPGEGEARGQCCAGRPFDGQSDTGDHCAGRRAAEYVPVWCLPLEVARSATPEPRLGTTTRGAQLQPHPARKVGTARALTVVL